METDMTKMPHAIELKEEDLDTINGGPTAVEYAVTRGPKGLDKPRKGDEGGLLRSVFAKFDG